LISPIAINEINDRYKTISIVLKHAKAIGIPKYDPAQPISRDFERRFYSNFGWPVYWGGGGRWGNERMPSALFTAAPIKEVPVTHHERERATWLRTITEIMPFRVFAQDNALGPISDLIINDETWEIRYIVVDARPLCPGRYVLISPHWISVMSMGEKVLTIDIPSDTIRRAPQYNPAYPITRDYEFTLFCHYGRCDEVDAEKISRKVIA
jgi:hypothetical protein